MRLREAVVKVPEAVIVALTGRLIAEVEALGPINVRLTEGLNLVLREAAPQREHINPPTGFVRLTRGLILEIDAFTSIVSYGTVRVRDAAGNLGPLIFGVVGELVDGHAEVRVVSRVVGLHLREDGLELGVASGEFRTRSIRLSMLCGKAKELLIAFRKERAHQLSGS